MNSPLVSVIIPTYSRNEMLERAILSILNQTYKNIEIIVVDDNNPKSEHRKYTENIMKKYKENYKVKYIKNTRNLGAALSRNEGILNSEGEIICFLDDDDEYMENCIEEKVNFFIKNDNPRLALVYGMCEIIEVDKKYKKHIFGNKYKGNCIYELLKIDCISATSQWACKKSALIDVGMFSNVVSKQDSMLMLKLFEKNYEIDYIDKPLSKFYIHNGIRISNSGKALEGEIELRKYGRKLYDRLSSIEILDIEYNFSSRLLRYYIEKNMFDKTVNEIKIMFIIYPFKSIKRICLEIARQLKDKIIKS